MLMIIKGLLVFWLPGRAVKETVLGARIWCVERGKAGFKIQDSRNAAETPYDGISPEVAEKKGGGLSC